MTEQTVEFDLAEVIGGSVDSIAAKLSQLSDAELAALGAMEAEAVKPRKGVIDAIAAEVAGRPKADAAQADMSAPVTDAALAAVDLQAARIATLEGEKAELTEQLGEATGRVVALEAICTAISAGLDERGLVADGEAYLLEAKVFAVIDGQTAKLAELTSLLDEATAAPDAPTAERCEALTAENTELRRANADLAGRLTQQAEGAPGSKRAAKRRALKIDDKAGEPVAVVFGDSMDMLLAGLGELAFDTAAFADAGGAPTLHRDIEIDGDAPAGEVAAVWAIDANGKAVGVSRFNVPVTVGGGRVAQFKRRSLLFIAG